MISPTKDTYNSCWTQPCQCELINGWFAGVWEPRQSNISCGEAETYPDQVELWVEPVIF